MDTNRKKIQSAENVTRTKNDYVTLTLVCVCVVHQAICIYFIRFCPAKSYDGKVPFQVIKAFIL